MSAVLEETLPASTPARSLRADSLAASVVIMLVMTVAQRLIGFGRGVLFCRWMDPDELGQWDIAFAFLNLAAPVAVLGLPGSFGRYAEYFRRTGQLHTFLKRTALACSGLGLAAMLGVIAFRDQFSWWIFGVDDCAGLVVCVALCLGVLIAHNFLTSLFIAVRLYRFVTILQFVQSLSFAVISIALLLAWPAGAADAVIGFAVATLLSGLGAVTWLRGMLAGEERAIEPVAHGPFWSKLAAFAGWMWVTNLLAGLFDVVDRYMIIHHGNMSAHEALAQVGNYHSSRIIPLLFVGVAGLLSAMITPHLIHDWEAGNQRIVERRLNLVLKGMLFTVLGASVGVLLVAPWLFTVAFANKFQGGLEVLPCTLAYCGWFGVSSVAQNYLWCKEKAGLCSMSLLLGMLLNIGLNLIWLPRYGLEGAVWATTAANLLVLVLVYALSTWHGMQVDRGTWLLSLALAALCLGPWAGVVTLTAVLALTLCGNFVLTADEKRHLLGEVEQRVQSLARRLRRPARRAPTGE